MIGSVSSTDGDSLEVETVVASVATGAGAATTGSGLEQRAVSATAAAVFLLLPEDLRAQLALLPEQTYVEADLVDLSEDFDLGMIILITL